MNDFGSLSEVDLINLKLAGVRAYTPSYKWIRGYADLGVGYSYLYDHGDSSHHLGLDFSLGIQVLKRFAFGLDVIHCTPDPFSYAGIRLSCLF